MTLSISLNPARRYRRGLTLIEIMVGIAILGVLMALAVPSLLKYRERSQLRAIQSNLRIIETAKDQWAIANRKGTGDPIDNLGVIKDFLKGGTFSPVVGEVYAPNAIGTPPVAVAPVPLMNFPKGAPITAPPE